MLASEPSLGKKKKTAGNGLSEAGENYNEDMSIGVSL